MLHSRVKTPFSQPSAQRLEETIENFGVLGALAVELPPWKIVQKKFKNYLTPVASSGIVMPHTVTKNTEHTIKMRTKTLLVAAAALAATVISSQAQVYSGVVGYVNVVLPAGQLVLVSNPLDDGTNTTTSLGANLANKSSIQVWNGTGFTGANKASGVWTPDLSIPVGTGFFVNSKTTITNTFVGAVVAAVGGSVTNSLPAGTLVLVGSEIPFTGDLNDTNLNIGTTLANKSSIQVWTGNGYLGANKASGVWTPNITITNGEGFFVNSKTATNWVQTLPSN